MDTGFPTRTCAKKIRGEDGHETQGSRCRRRGPWLDRRYPLQRTGRSRAEGGRARARRDAFHRKGLFRPEHPRRAALRGAPRPDAEHRARHHHGAQQSRTGSAADAPARLVPSRRSGRRLGGALERAHVALDRHGVQGPLKLRRALRQELHSCRHDDPGLGHHLRRARALLRQVRAHRRDFRQGRQHQGRDPARRKPIRGAARARISAAAAHTDPCERDVRECGAERRLSSVPAPVGERVTRLHQSGRLEVRRMPVLRLLPALRLRGERERLAAHHGYSDRDEESEFRAAHPFVGNQGAEGFGRQKGDGRHLHQHPERRGIRAAGRHGAALRLRDQQCASDAVVGHRRAL